MVLYNQGNLSFFTGSMLVGFIRTCGRFRLLVQIGFRSVLATNTSVVSYEAGGICPLAFLKMWYNRIENKNNRRNKPHGTRIFT